MTTSEGYKEFLLWRMIQAITFNIVVQFFLISIVIFIENINIIHPISWIQTTWSTIFCLRMLSYFFILAIIIFIQGFICSKNYLNSQYAKSRFAKFCSMFSLRNVIISSLCVLIGGVIAWLHLSLNGGRYSSVTKQCNTDSNNNCFVEEYYYLILSGFWTGFYFVQRANILENKNLQFSIIPQTKFSQLCRGIYIILPNAMISAIEPSLQSLGFYYMLGNTLRNCILSIFLISVENEPLYYISNLFQPILMYHAWLHAVLFVLSINSMHLLFQAYLTEWVAFTIEQNDSATEKSRIPLMDALKTNEIPIVQHLAFFDLTVIAQKDKLRRKLLFALSQPGGHPYNWNCIVERCIATIKEFANDISLTTTSVKKDQIQVNGPTLAKSVIKSDSEKPVYVYHMRNLASPSASSPIKAINCEIPKQSVPGEQLISHYFRVVKQSFISYLLSKPLINYIFAEQIDTKVKHILLNAQPVIWAADAISSLVAISIKEDPYGIVQKDLPKVIEALLSAKESLDKLQKMNVSLKKPVSEEKDFRQMLTALRSTIRRSIYRIVCTFRDYIDDLGLEPYTVTQLQIYINCRE